MNFYILTLGCKVNSYESEAMASILNDAGFKQINDDSLAQIAIINTCSVTHVSDAKSRQMIRKMISNNPDCIICVVGCYAQMALEQVKQIEGVNIILGTKYRNEIAILINEFILNKKQIIKVDSYNKDSQFENLQVSLFHQTRAFIKIQDGCDNYCSYCIIPFARGPQRSKNFQLILEEIKNIVNNGYQEIVLTGIHTGAYSDNNYRLSDLISKILDENPKLKRLRISSIEIMEIDDKLISLIKENKVLAKHLHIPLQSGSNHILKLMNRRYDASTFENIIDKIKFTIPDILITTDVIVGFPQETINDFEETIQFIQKIAFSRLHVFPYSPRNGTIAANLSNQIEASEKKKRVDSLLSLSRKLHGKYLKEKLNTVVEVFFESFNEKSNSLNGYTSDYLKVIVKGNKELVNSQQEVYIQQFLDDILIGNIYNK